MELQLSLYQETHVPEGLCRAGQAESAATVPGCQGPTSPDRDIRPSLTLKDSVSSQPGPHTSQP
ncbi:hypothetical protein P7K49_019082, partial [Saguinus oedipus]